MISRETADLAKQESSSTSDTNNGGNNSFKATTSWSRLKDPRIVRVSRAFGGKDRHSKVCTVRGLRDRRVRLSVPTAIQLYDLQDRLGLNQPSKVVDWLLNAAKNEIDELPPLQFPQGSFSATLLPMLNTSNQTKSKQVSAETRERDEHSWARSSSSHEDEGRREFNLGLLNQNQNPSCSLMNNGSSSIPFNSFVRWDPSNLTLSHPPRSPCSSSPQQDWHNNFSLVAAPLQSHHHHQVLVYQPAAGSMATAQPYFQSEFDAKQINYQTSASSPTVEFNMTANLLPSQNNDGS